MPLSYLMAKKNEIKTDRQRLLKKVIEFAMPFKYYFILALVLNLFFSALTTLSVALIQPLFKIIFNPVTETALSNTEPAAQDQTFFSQVVNDFQQVILNFINTGGGLQDVLLNLSFLIILVFVLKHIFKYLGTIVSATLHEGIVKSIRDSIFEKLTSLSLDFFSAKKQGHLISIITNDVSVINQNIVASFTVMFRDGVQVLLFLFLLFGLSLELTLISFSTSIIGFFLIKYSFKFLKRYANRMQVSMGDYTSTMQETIGGIRIVKAFNAEDTANKRFFKDSRKYWRAAVKHKKIQALIPSINEILAIVALCVVLFVGGGQVADKEMMPEDLTAFLFALFAIMSPIANLLDIAAKFTRGFVAAERVMTVLDQKPKLISGTQDFSGFHHNIEAKNVSFAYGKDIVINDVSFTLEKGKKIAFVGASGSGKSTMSDIIVRFYDPNSGEILLDGIDITKLNLKDYRALFGMVSQETILFNDTIANNIRYGDDSLTDEDVIEATKRANAYAFIKKLPDGIHTVIGDRGDMLSGGERQRIAIARALVRDPQILIFDEATSSLDAESEKVVQDAINNSLKDKTAIIVAHRLSTVIGCDEILVFQNGKITERGTHSELISQLGAYSKLYNIQFAEN